MADIRMQVDEVKLCVKSERLLLHGVRRDADGRVVDHVDLVLPWTFQRALLNLDNLDRVDSHDMNLT